MLRSPCTYRNAQGRCEEGWVWEPDGYGCVESHECPRCLGTGIEPLIDVDQFNNKGQRDPDD